MAASTHCVRKMWSNNKMAIYLAQKHRTFATRGNTGHTYILIHE